MPAGPQAAPPQVGERYTYQPADGKPHGESHKGSPLTAEMTELDMDAGTEVYVLDLDADSGWPHLQWTDKKGLPRITTFDPDEFAGDFQPLP